MNKNPRPLLSFERDVPFLYARAKAHWREERYPQALQLLHLALEMEPENPRLLLGKARVLGMMGAFSLSRRQAICLLAAGQRGEEALFLIGSSAYALGETRRAESFLEHYAHRYPGGKHQEMVGDLLDDLRMQRHYALLWRHQRTARRALDALAAGRLHYAGHALRHLRKAAPTDPLTLALAAMMACAQGRYPEALLAAKDAYQARPEPHPMVLCAMATALAAAGLSPLAGQYIRRADEASDDLWSSTLAARTAGRLGLHDLCRRLWGALHRDMPGNQEALQQLILANYNAGQLGEASRLLSDLVLTDPGDPVAPMIFQEIEWAQERTPPTVLPLPYRWGFLPGSPGFLQRVLPLLRQALPPEGVPALRQATALIRWGLHNRQIPDGEMMTLVEVLAQMPGEAPRALLREMLLAPGRAPRLKQRALRALVRAGQRGELLMERGGRLQQLALGRPSHHSGKERAAQPVPPA